MNNVYSANCGKEGLAGEVWSSAGLFFPLSRDYCYRAIKAQHQSFDLLRSVTISLANHIIECTSKHEPKRLRDMDQTSYYFSTENRTTTTISFY